MHATDSQNGVVGMGVAMAVAVAVAVAVAMEETTGRCAPSATGDSPDQVVDGTKLK